jgi:hypothetical protein
VYMGEAKYMQVRKSRGKRRFGRCRRKWENYIKVDFQEIGRQGMGCIYQDYVL